MTISKTREKELRSLVAGISKDLKLAPGDLLLGKDIKKERPRTTSGILALDVALGGGIPLNQWIEIVGHESGGKTATAMQIVAAQQAKDPDWICLWVAAEGFEFEFAEMHGIEVDRLVLVEMNSMEEVFDTVIKAVEARAVDGIVIDSFPALVPTGEYEKLMEDYTVGLGARIFNKFFRKVQKAARRSMVDDDRNWLGIIINQWREQIGVMYGDPRITPGGKGKNYSYYVRLEVARDEWIENGLTGRQKHPVGQTIRCKIFKNKSGPPQRTAYYDFYFDDFDGFEAGEIDMTKDVFLTAEAIGVLSREEGKNTYYFLGEKVGGNRSLALKKLDDDEDLLEAIAREVYATIRRKAPAEPEDEPEPEEKPKKPPAKKAPAKKAATRRVVARK